MAAEGRISTYLCLITCSIVLFKTANVQLASSFRMAGKEVAGGVLRERKPFFLQLLVLAEEKNEHFVPKKSNFVS